MLALVVGSVAATIAIAFLMRAAPPLLPRNPTESQVSLELRAVLMSLKRTWQPKARARVLARARPHAKQFEPFVLAILKDPRHKLCPEACDLAGAFRYSDAQPLLASLGLNARDRVRARAIPAAESLAPWHPDDLASLLRGDNARALVATLEVCAARPDRPLIDILPLLEHEDEAIRKAALAAVPTAPTYEHRRALLDFARGAEGESVLFALEALSHTGIDPEIESLLVSKLNDPDIKVRFAALDALTTKRSKLLDPEAVWSPSQSFQMDVLERAKALYCLEKTRSYDVESILEELPGMDPFSKHFAARCLIVAGEREGVAALLDVVQAETVDFDEISAAQIEAVIGATRILLAHLARTGPYEDIEAWETWYDGLTAFRPRMIPDAPAPLR